MLLQKTGFLKKAGCCVFMLVIFLLLFGLSLSCLLISNSGLSPAEVYAQEALMNQRGYTESFKLLRSYNSPYWNNPDWADYFYSRVNGIGDYLINRQDKYLYRFRPIVRVNEGNNGDTVVMKKRQILIITLPSNISTGAGWFLDTDSLDKYVVEPIWGPYYFQKISLNFGGAPGYELCIFQAREPGTTTIKLEYKSPWEDYVDDTFEIEVVLGSVDEAI